MNANTMNKPSATDWKKLTAMPDEDIDYSDIPPLGDEFFQNAQLRHPGQKVSVTMEMDTDVLDWFKTHDANWQDRILAALRLYAETHRVYETAHV